MVFALSHTNGRGKSSLELYRQKLEQSGQAPLATRSIVGSQLAPVCCLYVVNPSLTARRKNRAAQRTASTPPPGASPVCDPISLHALIQRSCFRLWITCLAFCIS